MKGATPVGPSASIRKKQPASVTPCTASGNAENATCTRSIARSGTNWLASTGRAEFAQLAELERAGWTLFNTQPPVGPGDDQWRYHFRRRASWRRRWEQAS